MATRLPNEVLALVIEHAHPYDLVNIACTCAMMSDFCKDLLSYHRQLSSQWKSVDWVNEKYAGNALELGYKIAENELLLCHIRSLTLLINGGGGNNTSRCYPGEVRDQLIRLISLGKFASDLSAEDWYKGFNRTREFGPVIALLLSRTSSLKDLNISIEALNNKYVLAQLTRPFTSAVDPLATTTGSLMKLERLLISCSGSLNSSSFPVEFLFLFPSLRRLEMDSFTFCYEAGAKALESDVPAISVPGGSLLFLESMSLGSVDLNAFSFILIRCPTLRKVYVHRAVKASYARNPEICSSDALLVHPGRKVDGGVLRNMGSHALLPLPSSELFPITNLIELSVDVGSHMLSELLPISEYAPRSLEILKISSLLQHKHEANNLRHVLRGFIIDEWPRLGWIDLRMSFHFDCNLDDHGQCSDPYCDAEQKLPSPEAVRKLVNLLRECGIPVCSIAYSNFNYQKWKPSMSNRNYHTWYEYRMHSWGNQGPPTVLFWQNMQFHVGKYLCASDNPSEEIDIRFIDSEETYNRERSQLRAAIANAQAKEARGQNSAQSDDISSDE